MATHFYFNGHTYEIESAALSWSDADANAAGLTWVETRDSVTVNAYLAVIESAEENAAILKHVKQSVLNNATIANDGDGADYLWLGASDSALEGTWVWNSGSALGAYQNWGSGSLGAEPNDSLGAQDYMGFAREAWPQPGGGIGVAGQWNDLDGSDLLWSIIEWDGLIGTEGVDRLIGTSGDDMIDGNAGNDIIKAGGGDDIVYAGDGADNVDAGEGDNYVDAETGDIHSDDGNDKVKCGSGDDFIRIGAGDDIVNAGNGNNMVFGADGNDKITTGSGNDTINIDGFYTEDGIAGAGDDQIKAGAGDDYIVGGSGADIIWGGTGNDIFAFDNLASEGVDTIKDFDAGTAPHGVADAIYLDSSVFTSLAAGALSAEFFVKGPGLSAPPLNETGFDDYLIFDTKTHKLYYDADANATAESPVLIAIIHGKTSDLGFEDFLIY